MRFELPTATLRLICDVCHPVRDPDPGKSFAINGVRFAFRGGSTFAVGTDGRQMAVVNTDKPHPGGCEDFTVDLTKLSAKRKSLSNTGPEKLVSVTTNDKLTYVQFSWKSKKEFNIVCPIIEGRFPKYEGLLPEQCKAEGCTTVDADVWAEKWPLNEPQQSFDLFTTDKSEKVIDVVRSEWTGTLPTVGSKGSSRVKVNMDYLVDHLGRLGKAEADIRFYGPKSAIRVDSPQVVYLLMPIGSEI